MHDPKHFGMTVVCREWKPAELNGGREEYADTPPWPASAMGQANQPLHVNVFGDEVSQPLNSFVSV